MIRDIKLLSDSGLKLLRGCPRRYELSKYMGEREENVDLVFGKAVGAGIQTLFQTNDVNKAILSTFVAWTSPDILEEDAKGERDGKNLFYAVQAILNFKPFLSYTFSDYELLYVNTAGRPIPACELGFKISLGDGFYQRGFIDIVLLNKKDSTLLVLELKTTKFSKVVDAMFANSDQALGYAVVVDKLCEGREINSREYRVCYPVYKTKEMDWDILIFEKSGLDRARWISEVIDSKDRIVKYIDTGFFPMYGSDCYSYFRECEFYGICELKNSTLFMGKDLTVETEPDEKFMYHFDIQDIIMDQLAKLEQYGE